MNHFNEKGFIKMTDQTTQTAFEFLMTGDHEKLIYSAISKLGVPKRHPDYDDLVQEGRLVFVTIFRKYPQDPLAEPKQFLAYAHKALYRQLLNQRLKTKRLQDKHAVADETNEAGTHVDALHNEVVDEALLIEWLQLCNTNEQRFLIGSVRDRMTPTEIAERWGVSRQAVYKWRSGLRKKLANVLGDND
ncbi:hypothetical protein FD14_GL001275 [Secundilactobacillus similis DSM 23365 = JCM 2765]|uniref:RNA polymerase sigma-70 region 2 domain-containing protein n=2 Tax=Secundilactobacillus similis TaxID=414682 RepID=A0A0R2EXV4_9LACO|nr:hypothetical protein FD14_GL001275 [Secundilactobacillus similis DSM 23365 = JCM 2765]